MVKGWLFAFLKRQTAARKTDVELDKWACHCAFETGFGRCLDNRQVTKIRRKMEVKKPLILVSNDDGYHAKGLRSLVAMLTDFADVVVCAPDAGRSGFAGAFSVAKLLLLKKRKDVAGAPVWSSNGTPVDCVKLAFSELFAERQPDLILSGINHGDNAAVNVHYSGTMGVVIEGCLKGLPSVGFSLADPDEDADFEPLRPYVRDIVGRVLAEGLPKEVCLNVNFPRAQTFKGVKVCRMNRGTWVNECEKRTHPHGYDYFWMAGHFQSDEPEAQDTDHWALKNGYVAIVPTRIDVTCYDSLQRMKAWEKEM